MPRLQAKNLFGDSRLIEKAFLAEWVAYKETSQLGKQLLRLLLGDEVAAGERAAAHIGRDLAPVGQAVKKGLDHRVLTPQGEHRHLQFSSRILAVVHEIDGRRSAVILAGGVDGARIAEG